MLYKQAMMHRSITCLQAQNRIVNNERLEFLGDSILDATIADYLFEMFPTQNEGFLTKLRSKIVNRNNLNTIAFKLGIDTLLVTNNINESANNSSIYGNALEALIGAIYLDRGFKFTRSFVINAILEKHINLNELQNIDPDSKSRLIEFCQKHHVTFEFITTEDPHTPKQTPKFTTILTANGKRMSEGHGPSKKDAEQNAAKAAMALLQETQMAT